MTLIQIPESQFYLHSYERLEDELRLARIEFKLVLKSGDPSTSVEIMRYGKSLRNEIERRQGKKRYDEPKS